MHYKKALKHRYSDALTEAGALYNRIVGQPLTLTLYAAPMALNDRLRRCKALPAFAGMTRGN